MPPARSSAKGLVAVSPQRRARANDGVHHDDTPLVGQLDNSSAQLKIDENKPKIVRSTSSILHSPEMHVIRVNSMDCYSNHPKRTSSILSMLQLHAFVVLGRHHVAIDNSHTVRIQPED